MEKVQQWNLAGGLSHGHVRFGSRGMGNYAGREAGSTSCPYYIKRIITILAISLPYHG